MDRVGALILAVGTILLIAFNESPVGMFLLILVVVGARAGLRFDDEIAWQTVAASSGGVLVIWFLFYGWMSEFPGIDHGGGSQPSAIWFFVTLLLVTAGLAYVARERPEIRGAWTTGAWVWFVLTMWPESHVRASSGWNFSFAAFGVIGLGVIGVCEIVRSLSHPVGRSHRK